MKVGMKMGLERENLERQFGRKLSCPKLFDFVMDCENLICSKESVPLMKIFYVSRRFGELRP
ncbi:unnamed protein product [Camellia sinensis]